METVDLDMGDVFGEERDDDEDIGAVGTLPDLPEATQDPDNDEDNAEVLQRLKDLSKGAAKKVVRRPQPKLDPTRLTGERGIPILPKLGEKIKFKGKGHEAEDLGALMRCMEHWAHRLFPRMPFDEVVERVEKLGAKKEVQTCVKKMRLDMPILDQDFVGSDRGEDEEEEGANRGIGDEGEPQKKMMDLDAEWEELMREEDELRASQAPPPATPTRAPQPGPSSRSEPIPSTSGGGRGVPGTPGTPGAKAAQSTQSPGLTAEQLERMERNKQLAQERKLRKLGIASPAPSRPTATNTSPASQQSQSASDRTVSQQSQSASDRTVSQSSQASSSGNQSTTSQTANTSNQSTPSQTGSQSSQQIESESGNNLATQPDRTRTETQASHAQKDEEMTEVLDKVPSQSNVVETREEDAQELFTATAINSQDNLNSELVGGASQMENDGTESKGNSMEDSEEMSEVIERQDNGNVEPLRPTQVPLVNDTVTDSMDEMSEVIEKQDALIRKSVNMLDGSEEDKENLTYGAGNVSNLKQKPVTLQNHSDFPKDVVPDIEDELNDNVNEEEMMDILDQ